MQLQKQANIEGFRAKVVIVCLPIRRSNKKQDFSPLRKTSGNTKLLDVFFCAPSRWPDLPINRAHPLDRLTLAEYSIDDSNEAFTIDDLGNRDSVIVRDGNNVNYDIDNLTNRYDSVGGNTLAYDAAGNLTTDKDGYQYEYDYENRITKIIKTGPTTVAEFAYDALGRRIKKRDSIANTNNIYYYNDNWQILCDYNDTGAGGTPERWFAYGNYIDEALLMSKSFTSWSYARYYIHDHLYSPVALLHTISSSPIERYEYDAYGNCYIMDISYNPRSSSSYSNPYYFTGRETDSFDSGSLKIMNYRHRYYDTYTGRFITHDPMRYIDGLNLYEYVSSNPIVYLDPRGFRLKIGIIPDPWEEDLGPPPIVVPIWPPAPPEGGSGLWPFPFPPVPRELPIGRPDEDPPIPILCPR